MSLLEDAREIARYGPVFDVDCEPCPYCLAMPHQEECVWLSMPKIVAALEAAEALKFLRLHDMGVCSEELLDEAMPLLYKLWGVP